MPKDWDNHKVEIERLYMVEHRPLKDVRNIMRTQHAFDASIRSYRMKLDEWRMWKNNSKNERRRTKTIARHRQPRAIVLSESLAEASSSREPISVLPPPVDISGSTQSDFIYGISIPRRSLDIAELLPMLSSLCSNSECALEIMLNKWKSDGSYFKAALNYLEENKANFRMKSWTSEGKTILNLIAIAVASHEKYPLAKMCLKIDFDQAQHENRENWDLISHWMRPWREACAAQSWKEVKECFFGLNSDIYLNSDTYRDSLFLCTALPLLAEQLLQKILQKLEYWRDRGGLISTFEADQAKVCRQEYMDILGSFKEDEFDVDPIWYKRCFQFYDPDDAKHWAYKNLQFDQLREYRQRFSQLKILHDSASSADGLVPNLLNAVTVLKESKVILDTVQSEDVPITNADVSPLPSTHTMSRSSQRPYNELRVLLKDAYENWVIGHDIHKNMNCLVTHLKSLKISNPLSPEENVFILISHTIPLNNQFSFTLDVIKVITDSWRQMLEKDYSRYGWQTWIAVRDSSTLKSLMEIMAKEYDLTYEIRLNLDDRMQPVVVKLILDAFTGLVGESLLLSLKAHIKGCHAYGLSYTSALHSYKSILDRLHRRKIKLNQDLFAFLGRLLVWKGINENGAVDVDDVDEEERPFFETSNEESNDSESESFVSENESEDQ